jgi:serine/threonine protein kinase
MPDVSYPDALPAQHHLHWYVLERVLGQGGFGITYLARDTNLDQQVAIKEYLPVDVASRRPDAQVRSRTEDSSERYRWGLDRFIREARTLAKFDHPNIVRVLSVFEHNSTAYMVMRFEEGENLAALLERRRTLPEDELMRVVAPILDGLELVHNAGFIHRDIKPDNIHIRADGSPVLLDFGSARHSLGHARTVTILVAPGYAPFEQYYSSGEDQGPWTDLYSLGATCYRAIAGIAPMDAIARSKGVLGSTREVLVPAATIGAGRYSAGLLKAIDHALAFAEKDRPQSIAEWRQELAGGGKVPTRAISSSSAPAAAPATPSIRGPVIWATLGALVAAAAVVFLMVPLRDSGKAKDPAPPPVVEAKPPAPAPAPPAVDTAKLEADREAAEKKAQQARERKLAEEAEAARQQAEAEKARAKREARAKAEAEKKAKAQAEAERVAREKAAAAAAQKEAAAKAPATAALAPPPGDAAAFTYYIGHANRGNAEAALKVAEMFESGRGTAPSNNWAHLWYSVAELRGAPGAGPKKAAIAALLQPKEIEQNEKQAKSLALRKN